jgi:hypothetical protein
MTNTKHGRSRQAGLVEVLITDDDQVLLQMFPPAQPRVQLPMTPGQARGLARGLLDGADEAEAAAARSPAEPPFVTGLPEV